MVEMWDGVGFEGFQKGMGTTWRIGGALRLVLGWRISFRDQVKGLGENGLWGTCSMCFQGL